MLNSQEDVTRSVNWLCIKIFINSTYGVFVKAIGKARWIIEGIYHVYGCEHMDLLVNMKILPKLIYKWNPTYILKGITKDKSSVW